ncbi:MAG: universal stress protein, partial [Thermoleophilia bacterium]|nr:universal stress protein [Thermoleophilia bacterium]
MSTLVLGYDGSPSANAALAKTIEVAPVLGASVVVVFGYYLSPLGGGDVRDFKERLESIAAHEVARAVADLVGAGIETSSRILTIKPAEAILAGADEGGAAMIVVGTVGESPISGAILGSVVL